MSPGEDTPLTEGDVSVLLCVGELNSAVANEASETQFTDCDLAREGTCGKGGSGFSESD